MSQSDVNELKAHINQLVLGSAQTYINILRSEIIQLVEGMKIELINQASTQLDDVKELLSLQGFYIGQTLDEILLELRELSDWDESELTG
jgi:hypothetical protein